MGISELYIIKRDGKRAPFSVEKIKRAISKAFLSVGGYATDDDLTSVLSRVHVSDGMSVEEIQNQVEVALMAERYFAVAKSYMLYRQKHSEDREERDKLRFLTNYCDAKNPATGSKYRRQRQRREQEHRHADRRAAEAELHPPEPPSAHGPDQGDVRQGAVGQVSAPAERSFHLQERRNLDGQLLRLDHDVSVAAERHAVGRRQLDAPDEPQIVLRRIRQHGLHRVVDALGGLRHARIPDVHELFHRTGVRRRLLQACRRGGGPLEKAPHDRQDDHRLFRADRLLDQPAYRSAQLPGRVLERRLLRPATISSRSSGSSFSRTVRIPTGSRCRGCRSGS